jgi:hypothetical protein
VRALFKRLRKQGRLYLLQLGEGLALALLGLVLARRQVSA